MNVFSEIKKRQILLDIYLREFEGLREEINSRIGYRDNLIYVTLASIGGLITYTFSQEKNNYGLLILPLVTFILGWMYVLNDEKISAIGYYFKGKLSNKIKLLLEIFNHDCIFEWEEFLRSKERKRLHKGFQIFVNQLTFVFSGLVSLIVFFILEDCISFIHLLIMDFEMCLQLILFGVILDFKYRLFGKNI